MELMLLAPPLALRFLPFRAERLRNPAIWRARHEAETFSFYPRPENFNSFVYPIRLPGVKMLPRPIPRTALPLSAKEPFGRVGDDA